MPSAFTSASSTKGTEYLQGDILFHAVATEDIDNSFRNRKRCRARIVVVIISALYGTDYVSIKFLEEHLDPSLIAALRFGLAALIVSPFLRGSSIKSFKNGVEVGVWVTLGYFAQSIALVTITASKSAVICSLAVIFVPILDSIFVKNDEPQTGHSRSKWIAALLAVGGVVSLEFGSLEPPVLGDIWAMMQPICFGIGFWRMEKHTRSTPELTNQLTAVQLLTVAIMSLIWLIISNIDFFTVIPVLMNNVIVTTSLLWSGTFSTAFTVSMETMVLKDISAAESTVILSSEPLWGCTFAVLLLGEPVGLHLIIGALLILCACLWSILEEYFSKITVATMQLVGIKV